MWDRGSIIRAAIVVVTIIGVLVAGGYVVTNGHSYFALLLAPLYQFPRSLPLDVIEHVIAILAVGFALFNYHAVLGFIRRSLTSTDELVINNWYVYRYTKAASEPSLLKDLWVVRRNISRGYVVNMYPLHRIKRNAYGGTVVCNERDRFNILLDGKLHEEQSLICFMPRIGTGNDTRMLALAVGDDADYVLSCRVYLASRRELEEEFVKGILDDAIQKIRTANSEQLIQLTQQAALEILKQHKMPIGEPTEVASRGIISKVVHPFHARRRDQRGVALPSEVLAPESAEIGRSGRHRIGEVVRGTDEAENDAGPAEVPGGVAGG